MHKQKKIYSSLWYWVGGIMKNIIEDIKRYIDSEAVKNKIALDLGLKFKNNKCLCFLHSESNPSMAFDSKKKKFKCFSCGQSYDIIIKNITINHS